MHLVRGSSATKDKTFGSNPEHAKKNLSVKKGGKNDAVVVGEFTLHVIQLQ